MPEVYRILVEHVKENYPESYSKIMESAQEEFDDYYYLFYPTVEEALVDFVAESSGMGAATDHLLEQCPENMDYDEWEENYVGQLHHGAAYFARNYSEAREIHLSLPPEVWGSLEPTVPPAL